MATAYATGNNIGQQAIQETLEGIVDRYSMSDVLDALALVCIDKGEHLRSNWQDKASARVWDRIGVSIQKAQIKAQDARI